MVLRLSLARQSRSVRKAVGTGTGWLVRDALSGRVCRAVVSEVGDCSGTRGMSRFTFGAFYSGD